MNWGGEIVEKLRTKRPHCKIIKDSLLRRFSFFLVQICVVNYTVKGKQRICHYE